MKPSEYEVECPNCRKIFRHEQTVWSLLDKHTITVPCPSCGHYCTVSQDDDTSAFTCVDLAK
ncbi:MAG: hypothetical protein ABIB04_00690 [Patescibacteria group bacterium]